MLRAAPVVGGRRWLRSPPSHLVTRAAGAPDARNVGTQRNAPQDFAILTYDTTDSARNAIQTLDGTRLPSGGTLSLQFTSLLPDQHAAGAAPLPSPSPAAAAAAAAAGGGGGPAGGMGFHAQGFGAGSASAGQHQLGGVVGGGSCGMLAPSAAATPGRSSFAGDGGGGMASGHNVLGSGSLFSPPPARAHAAYDAGADLFGFAGGGGGAGAASGDMGSWDLGHAGSGFGARQPQQHQQQQQQRVTSPGLLPPLDGGSGGPAAALASSLYGPGALRSTPEPPLPAGAGGGGNAAGARAAAGQQGLPPVHTRSGGAGSGLARQGRGSSSSIEST
jgi:hypothetical protein